MNMDKTLPHEHITHTCTHAKARLMPQVGQLPVSLFGIPWQIGVQGEVRTSLGSRQPSGAALLLFA